MFSTCLDRTGFPLIVLKDRRLAVHVLPICKLQFEEFLADVNRFGDSWYDEVLAVNPRISARDLTNTNKEQLFLTGVLPGEAEQFAAWLGERFRLPTSDERLELNSRWNRIVVSGRLRDKLEASSAMMKRLLNLQASKRLSELSLLAGGVMEWVAHNDRFAVIGEPRGSFHSQLFDSSRVALPTGVRRHRLFGFRLVRDL